MALRIGLVQINNSFSGQNYFPYAAGLLQSYVQTHSQTPARYEFLLPIYKRQSVKTMVEYLLGADIIGFSTYVWNAHISLEVAKCIKQQKPETLIVFGGPQVPHHAESFLRQYPFINLVCHGEGEQVFLAILEKFPSETWEGVPSVSFLNKKGILVSHERAARMHDLSNIPSPYLSGVFEPLMRAHPKEGWLALWETNRGCPFSCAFCDWGSAKASKIHQFNFERITKEIDWFAKQKTEFIFCCDANFGILRRDPDIVRYVADIKKKTGYPQKLSVQGTKNATDRAYQVQKILSDSGLNKGATISFQSVEPETLRIVKRENISTESFKELQRRFARERIETYTDLILGLPGETYDSFVDGVSAIIENGQHNRIQFNNLSILPNAEMANLDYQKKYEMVTVKSKIFNIHGAVNVSDGDVPEYQELCVGTKTMPKEAWVKTRAFCWMAGLLYFDKLLQIPFTVLHKIYRLSYRELVETFMDAPDGEFPALSWIQRFFIDKALDIQNGASEYHYSGKWLKIGWPADEYVLIELCAENRLLPFYREAEEKLISLLKNSNIVFQPDLLHEALQFNKSLIRLPFEAQDRNFKASYNLWEFYQSVLTGEPIALEKADVIYRIRCTCSTYSTWEDWCREVIWYGNKKGAYLYGKDGVVRRSAKEETALR